MTTNEAPDYLMEQVDQYHKTMTAIKKMAVAEKKGPTDVPSLLVVRYGADSQSKAAELARQGDDENMILHEEDGVALCERLINLTKFAGPNSAPGAYVYAALTEFKEEYEGAAPWTVSVVADGIATVDPENPDWKAFRSLPENADRALHDLFCDEPQAQKWLSECINVFLMDVQGNMVSASSQYAYADNTFPPTPMFEPAEVRYEGKVFEKPTGWLQEQRVLTQMVLFFAQLELDGDDSH